MLGILDSFALISPILDLGVTGALMIMVWRLMIKKDKKSYEMIEAQNAERKEMYQSHSELIQEVTAALVDKNHTDAKMADAIIKLSEELRDNRHDHNDIIVALAEIKARYQSDTGEE